MKTQKDDVDTFFGPRTSEGKYEQQRLALNFETVASAHLRSVKSNYFYLAIFLLPYPILKETEFQCTTFLFIIFVVIIITKITLLLQNQGNLQKVKVQQKNDILQIQIMSNSTMMDYFLKSVTFFGTYHCHYHYYIYFFMIR